MNLVSSTFFTFINESDTYIRFIFLCFCFIILKLITLVIPFTTIAQSQTNFYAIAL